MTTHEWDYLINSGSRYQCFHCNIIVQAVMIDMQLWLVMDDSNGECPVTCEETQVFLVHDP